MEIDTTSSPPAGVIMKFLKKMKDGGPDSTVTGYWLIEDKKLFSIVLLKFEGNSRKAFHTHAFDSISWVLKGKLIETFYNSSKDQGVRIHKPSFWPIITKRTDFHKVDSEGTTWVISFRGPWVDYWEEFREKPNKLVKLTHGRKIVKNSS